MYDTIKVFTKEIVTFNQINVEEIDIHDAQKENFPEYNEEVYMFKNYESDKADKKEILTSECMYCENKDIQNNKK